MVCSQGLAKSVTDFSYGASHGCSAGPEKASLLSLEADNPASKSSKPCSSYQKATWDDISATSKLLPASFELLIEPCFLFLSLFQ